MTFVFDDKIRSYIQETGKKNIAVEVATSDGSDFEVSELHIHFISDKDADFFLQKKRFRAIDTDVCRVLLPPYKLEFDDTINFTVKKVLFFTVIKQTGIRL